MAYSFEFSCETDKTREDGTYLTYPTFLELCGEGVEPVLAGRQQFVLAHLPAPRLGGVAGPRLPGVGSDHLPELPLLLTFLTNHDRSVFLQASLK